MSAFRTSRASTLYLFLILSVYIAIGVQYAALTPAWQVPDEPAHYNYIRHLATTGTIPILQKGDYDQEYLSDLTATGFPPGKPVDSLRYENYQPPLYYVMAAPVFIASRGGLLPLRLFSLTLGAGVILLAFFIVRELFTGEPALALAAAGFVAFVPQHMAMMAGVNNDSLAELVIGGALWTTLGWLRGEGKRRIVGTEVNTSPRAWGVQLNISRFTYYALPLLIGAAFVTKGTAYIVAPIAGLALLLKGYHEAWKAKQYARSLAAVFGPAFAIGALWWGRNLAVYGWPDFLGLGRHNAIVVGQPRTAEWLAEFGGAELARRFAVTTFRSFWGQFGWMGVVMDERVYWALLAFSLFVLAGFAYAALGHNSVAPFAPAQRDGLTVLLVSCLLTIALYGYYNLTLVQHQGRYLFPALIPIGFGVSAGLSGWIHLIEHRLGRQGTKVVNTNDAARFAPCLLLLDWLPLGVIALLAALDVFALYRFIVPALSRF